MNIYMAGAEARAVVLHALGYPYRLASYFYLGKAPTLIQETSSIGGEWIMDSGLFSLMFGASTGKTELKTYDDFKRYASDYVEYMHKIGWKHAIVECDVQRLLGVEACQRLREDVFRPSGHDVIYVWHVPDGEEGLIDIGKRAKRIALSVPELRQVYGGGYPTKRALLHCLATLRKHGCSPRIHLLGNTENALMGLPAESSDSTSWIGSAIYGMGMLYIPKRRVIGKASVYSPKWRAWKGWCREAYPGAFSFIARYYKGRADRTFYFENLAASAISYWVYMEQLSGKQIENAEPVELRHQLRSRDGGDDDDGIDGDSLSEQIQLQCAD